jgi:hypothetical protein
VYSIRFGFMDMNLDGNSQVSIGKFIGITDRFPTLGSFEPFDADPGALHWQLPLPLRKERMPG